MRAIRYLAFCIALGVPAFGPAMGLFPKSEGKAAWEALQSRVLESLGGSCAVVTQPVERVSAISMPGTGRSELVLNKAVAASLQPMATVRFVVGPEKKRGEPQDAGGLLTFEVPAAGTYVLGTISRAWIDVVENQQNSFVKARHYEWVDFCGQRMKAGIFALRAGRQYWIQISASPAPVLDLFVAGPLN